ncbi:MAG: hypothetical protein QXW82_04800 [Candidatus Bathyarchaeia archaeon]
MQKKMKSPTVPHKVQCAEPQTDQQKGQKQKQHMPLSQALQSLRNVDIKLEKVNVLIRTKTLGKKQMREKGKHYIKSPEVYKRLAKEEVDLKKQLQNQKLLKIL